MNNNPTFRRTYKQRSFACTGSHLSRRSHSLPSTAHYRRRESAYGYGSMSAYASIKQSGACLRRCRERSLPTLVGSVSATAFFRTLSVAYMRPNAHFSQS